MITSYDGHPTTYHYKHCYQSWDHFPKPDYGSSMIQLSSVLICCWVGFTILSSERLLLRLQLALYQVYVLGVPWSPWTHPWLIRRGPSIPTVKHTLQIPRTDQTIRPKNDLQSAATVALLRCSTKNMDLFSVGILAILGEPLTSVKMGWTWHKHAQTWCRHM